MYPPSAADWEHFRTVWSLPLQPDVTSENMTAAYSRIMDVDMAEEMTSYTTYQILAQAGTSMLAQANERPSQSTAVSNGSDEVRIQNDKRM